MCVLLLLFHCLYFERNRQLILLNVVQTNMRKSIFKFDKNAGDDDDDDDLGGTLT